MDAITTEKIDHLLTLVRNLEKERAAQIYPGGLSPLVDAIQKIVPNALICLLPPALPDPLRQASAAVIVAVLLDTDGVQRYGLMTALGSTPIHDYIQPFLEAVDHAGNPDEIRRLGQITSRQVAFKGCNTYACAYQRVVSTRGLMLALTGYAH